MSRGIFITFEGGEGCGKSTQVARIADLFEAAGRRVRRLREPGGTAVGEAIRGILLDPANDALADRAELLLYEAARAQLVEMVIRPALEAGEIVICDRFHDSTVAYQGFARDLPLADVERLNAFATDGLEPDVTILLDLPAATGLARATAVSADRLESEDLRFHERVREGFLWMAAEYPQRVRIVDAVGTPDEVTASILAVLREADITFADDEAAR